jgi:hypothetical protein
VVLESTGIRALRRQPVFPSALPPPGAEMESASAGHGGNAAGELSEARKRDVCKTEFRRAHFFYDQLCPRCAALNWEKRWQSADLRGRVALVTGGRVKIGYQRALKLLRAGAHAIVTTRFSRDAARRFAAEPDFHEYAERLDIYRLDLRHAPSVEAFARHVNATYARLDFVINNACRRCADRQDSTRTGWTRSAHHRRRCRRRCARCSHDTRRPWRGAAPTRRAEPRGKPKEHSRR